MSVHLTYTEAIVTGLVQGVTELFPVSSLGHNVLLPALIGGSWAKALNVSAKDSPYLAFVVGLHVATAIAMIAYFWRDWLRIVRGFFSSLRTRSVSTSDERLAWMIILATIPVGIVGALLQKVFVSVFAKPELTAIFLAINGLILLYSERQRRARAAARAAVRAPVRQPAAQAAGAAGPGWQGGQGWQGQGGQDWGPGGRGGFSQQPGQQHWQGPEDWEYRQDPHGGQDPRNADDPWAGQDPWGEQAPRQGRHHRAGQDPREHAGAQDPWAEQDPRGGQSSRGGRSAQGGQDSWGAQDPRGGYDPRGGRDPRAERAPQGGQDPRGRQDPWGAQDPRGGRDPWGAQDPRGGQDPRGRQDSSDGRSSRSGQDPWGAQDPRGGQDPWGAQDPRGGQASRGGRDPRAAQAAWDAQDPRQAQARWAEQGYPQQGHPRQGSQQQGSRQQGGARDAESPRAVEIERAVRADQRLSTMGYARAILVGSAQILALLPGISRDGIVTVTGMWRGLSTEDAVRFSFLLSAPVILAAGLLKAKDLVGPMGQGIHGPVLVGSVLAGVGAYLSVRFLTRYFSEGRSLNPFGIYCLVMGVASFAYLVLK
jgi:undecaprenyl pyrophosphate phosphatase UppP